MLFKIVVFRAEAGSQLLSDILEQRCVTVQKKSVVKSVVLSEDKKYVKGVVLDSKEVIYGDFLCYSLGSQPELNLARSIDGLQVGRGVVVDERMETTVKSIFACGDCAEFQGMVFSNWTNAGKMNKSNF